MFFLSVDKEQRDDVKTNARYWIKIDEDGVNLFVSAFGKREPCLGILMQETVNRAFFFRSDDGVIAAAHADVSNVASSQRQDMSIIGLHMGMGPHHHAQLTVEAISEGLLFRSRIGVEIYEMELCWFFLKNGVHRFIRRTNRFIHKRLAEDVRNPKITFLGLEDRAPCPLMEREEICGANQKIGLADVVIDLAAGMLMIAQGHAVDAKFYKSLVVLIRKPFALCDVLAVCDHEIRVVGLP